jgi:hypothetical protein
MSITKTNADLEAIPVESVAPLLHPNEATIEASMVAAREDTLLDEVFASIEEAAARVLSPREAHVFNGRYRRVPPASLKELAAELRVGESHSNQQARVREDKRGIRRRRTYRPHRRRRDLG